MRHPGTSSNRIILSSQTGPLDRWQSWLLPCLLIVQAVFVGSTFRTLGMTASVTFLVLGIVYAFYLSTNQKSSNQSEENTDASGLNRSEGAQKLTPLTRATGKHGSRVELLQKFGEFKILRSGAIITIWFVVLVAVIAGATLRVGYHLGGNVNPIAMLVDSLAHSMLWMSLVLWFFFPRRGHPAMLACGIILVMATVTGGGVSRSITGQLSAALATLIAFAFASRQILGVWQNEGVLRQLRRRALRQFAANPFRRKDQRWEPMPMSTVTLTQDRSRSSVMFGVLALSILLTTASAIGQIASTVMPGMQSELFNRLSESLESVTGGGLMGGSRYVRGSKLGSVRRHMLGDPAEIALHAHAENEPGYLRGTVFDSYRSTGRWYSAASYQRQLFSGDQEDLASIQDRILDTVGEASTELRGNSIGPRDRVSLHSKANDSIVGTIELQNVPHKGRIAFTSLTTDWVEASSYGVKASHHDVIKGGINYAQPYVLGVGEENPIEELSPLRRSIMLGIPKPIGARVKAITERVCAGKLTPQAKAKAIEDHFEENFLYSLSDPGSQPDRDPVLNFLESQHPAHCEFFASAAAIMLRSVGVPTRYVTGYVVREMGDGGDYWIARNRDAHAWVEAYDENQQQWFPVEATTGRSYRTLMDNEVTSAGDATIADGFDDDDEQDSLFASVAGWILSFRTSDSLTFIFQVAQLPLLCLLVILLWVRHRQKQREGTDSIDLKSRKMLARVDRKVRKHKLVRSPFETIHQFAARVEASVGKNPESERDDSSSFLVQVAQWYRSFAAARYRGQMPEPPPETVLS